MRHIECSEQSFTLQDLHISSEAQKSSKMQMNYQHFFPSDNRLEAHRHKQNMTYCKFKFGLTQMKRKCWQISSFFQKSR